MLNYIWAALILVGIIYGIITGNLSSVTNGAIDSSKDAIELCITMCGVMALWCGLMKIAEKSGLLVACTKKLYPLMHYLFPGVPRNHEAYNYITANIIANFFGLGWAATPAGLKAMEELSKLEEERRNVELAECKKGIASNEMCTFLVLNISSLQLIPVNIIAYRSQYGSVNPALVVGPGIVATLCSTLAAVVFCKIMTRKRRC